MGGSRGLPDNIPVLVKAGATTATIAATNDGRQTRITLGGQQYAFSTALTLTITTSGAGGIDTGAWASVITLYYVYAVASSAGVVSLVASLADPATGPSGFSGRYKLVGALYSRDIANTIASTVSIVGEAATDWFPITFTGTLTTNVTYSGQIRRRGDMAEFFGNIAFSGANTQGDANFVWTTLLVDATKLPGGVYQNNIPVGVVNTQDFTGAGRHPGTVTGGSGSEFDRVRLDVIVTSVAEAFGNSLSTSVPRPADLTSFQSGDAITAFWKVPIQGWSKTLL